MRPIARVLPLLLILPALSLAPVFADDGEPSAPVEEPAPAPKPDPEVPTYSIEFLVPGEDAEIEGWKVVDAERAPAQAPSEDVFVAIGEALGLDDDTMYVEVTGLKKGDDVFGVAMVDVDAQVYAFQGAVKAKAAANGWRMRELGCPGRLLIVGGSAAGVAAAEEAMFEHVVYAMSEMAMNRLRGKAGHEEAGLKAAAEYSEAIRRMAPKAGVVHALTGVAHWLEARKELRKGGKHKKLNKELDNKAADEFAYALVDGVPFPPKKRVLLFVAGELGTNLLGRKDKSVVAAATRALELAVEHEKDARKQDQRYKNRYNLACAYARGGKTDEALDALRRSLEAMKSLKAGAARGHWEHIEKDKDMDSIRDDPRFSKMMADYEPKKPAHWERDRAHREKGKKKNPHNPHGN